APRQREAATPRPGADEEAEPAGGGVALHGRRSEADRDHQADDEEGGGPAGAVGVRPVEAAPASGDGAGDGHADEPEGGGGQKPRAAPLHADLGGEERPELVPAGRHPGRGRGGAGDLFRAQAGDPATSRSVPPRSAPSPPGSRLAASTAAPRARAAEISAVVSGNSHGSSSTRTSGSPASAQARA